MKIIIASLLLVYSLNATSQSSNKFYFDNEIHPVSKKKAEIYGIGEMDSGLYKLTCYYLKRKNPLACVAYFSDSTQTIHVGWFQSYFENGGIKTKGNYQHGEKEGCWISYNQKGNISDSIEYQDGRAIICKEFYDLSENHQKFVMVDDLVNNKFQSTLFDAKGNVISSEEIPQDYKDVYFAVDTTCSYPGGPAAWSRYITNAITSHISDFSDADYGTVLLRFAVDSDGNITNLKPLTMKTSMLAMIGYDAMYRGPKWIPAKHNGKNVKTFKIQPLTLHNQR